MTKESKIKKLEALANNNSNAHEAKAKAARIMAATMRKNAETSDSLDGLTRAHTAFATWADFAGAMDHGYVPTLRARRTTSGTIDLRYKNGIETEWLAQQVEAAGYRVYRG